MCVTRAAATLRAAGLRIGRDGEYCVILVEACKNLSIYAIIILYRSGHNCPRMLGVFGGCVLNQGNVKIGMGRTVAGILLGMLLAVASPLILLSEVFSLITVLLLPSIALIALYRWAGRGPAMFSTLLMLMVDFRFIGVPLMLAALLATILPPLLLLRVENRPFFQQLRYSIATFGVGIFAAIMVLYFSYGGDMIARALNLLPAAMRMQSPESLAPLTAVMGQILGRALTVEDFYTLYEQMIAQLIPQFQLLLPRLILSGALASALICAWLSNRMRAKRGMAAPGSFVPLRELALPSSTTGGLLLILAVSGLMRAFEVKSADTVYYAVYGIALVAFCTQTLGSMARRLRLSAMRPGTQRVVLGITAATCFLGAAGVAAIYGCASAILGSRGVLQQRARNRDNDGRFGGGE